MQITRKNARPPAETPQLSREVVRDAIVTAVDWYEQGEGPQDLPGDLDPEKRRLMEFMLTFLSEAGEA